MEIFNSTSELRDRGFQLLDPPVNIVAYDSAGDGADHDAVVLVSREEWRRGELWDVDLAVEVIFRVVLAQYLPNEFSFPKKLAALRSLNRYLNNLMRHKKEHTHVFAVETNGVGYAMASSLREKLPSTTTIGYTTVARVSEQTKMKGMSISMPRLPALDNLRTQMDLHRVKFAKNCVGRDLLIGELNSFVWAGKGRPEALSGQPDDAVMALCGGVWVGTKVLPLVNKQMKFSPSGGKRGQVTAMGGVH